jgi:hypothetical protein
MLLNKLMWLYSTTNRKHHPTLCDIYNCETKWKQKQRWELWLLTHNSSVSWSVTFVFDMSIFIYIQDYKVSKTRQQPEPWNENMKHDLKGPLPHIFKKTLKLDWHIQKKGVYKKQFKHNLATELTVNTVCHFRTLKWWQEDFLHCKSTHSTMIRSRAFRLRFLMVSLSFSRQTSRY